MRLAALLLVVALPVQASTCVIVAPSPADLDGACQPSQGDAPAATRPAPGRALSGDVLRPRARPDRLAVGETASSSNPSAPLDPLLSPRATLFWDVV